MKSLKLLLAAMLLCVTQFAFAVATPAQQLALDNALAAVALDPANQALADAAVQAAANADIAADVIVTNLFNLGAPAANIRNAMSRNIALGGTAAGQQNACSPACGSDHVANVSYIAAATNLTDATLALLGAGGATGAGGTPAAGGGGTGGTGGTSGGPNGAVSPS